MFEIRRCFLLFHFRVRFVSKLLCAFKTSYKLLSVVGGVFTGLDKGVIHDFGAVGLRVGV